MIDNQPDIALLIEPVALHLLGEPNRELSTKAELRFGRKGSMSVDLKKGTWYDWESGRGGGVLDLVMGECGLPTQEAAGDWLRAERYLDPNSRPQAGVLKPRPEAKEEDDAAQLRKRSIALRIWYSETAPAAGTVVEAYLRARGVMPPVMPYRIRLANLKHKSGHEGPCMVALITHGVTDAPLAIHRTWLKEDGSAKAGIEPAKMALGKWQGGCVKLAPPANHLITGEGIETCLAGMRAAGLGAWPALSTAGLKNLELPVGVRRVTVLVDDDPINPKTGARPGEQAARSAGYRWRRQRREVALAFPRSGEGTDFADIAARRA